MVSTTATMKQSARKLSIATEAEPDRVCGQALRIGSTGPLQTDLAMYRLRVKSALSFQPSPFLAALSLKTASFVPMNDELHRRKRTGSATSIPCP